MSSTMEADGSRGIIAAFDMLTQELFELRQTQEVFLEQLRMTERQKASGYVNSKLFGWNFPVMRKADADNITTYPDMSHTCVAISSHNDLTMPVNFFKDASEGRYDVLIEKLGYDPEICRDYVDNDDWGASEMQIEIHAKVADVLVTDIAETLHVKAHYTLESETILHTQKSGGLPFDRWIDIYKTIMITLGAQFDEDERVVFTPLWSGAIEMTVACARAGLNPRNKKLQDRARKIVEIERRSHGYDRIRKYIQQHPQFGIDCNEFA